MKKLFFIVATGVALVVASCSKGDIIEAQYNAIERNGNAITVLGSISSVDVTLKEASYEKDEQAYVDTLCCFDISDVYIEKAFSKAWSSDPENFKVVYKNLNFEILEKHFEVNLYVPYKTKEGQNYKAKTTFSFCKEIPCLTFQGVRNEEYAFTFEIKADLVEIIQNLDCKDPYSALLYEFNVTISDNGKNVGYLNFTRKFILGNREITFDPSVDDWDEENC